MKTLSSGLIRFLFMYGTASILFNFINIFVNLYVWQDGKSIFILSFYNLVMYLSWGACYFAGSYLITRWSNQIPVRISSISAGIGFLCLIGLHMQSHQLEMMMFAIPFGAFGGFYYSAQNLSISIFGQGEEFSIFFAYTNLISQVVAIATPILSAGAIELFGFRGSFVLMILLVLLMFGTSFTIPKVTLAPEKIISGRDLKRLVLATPMKLFSLGILMGGVFLQFQALFSLLFTFHVTQNTLLIAMLSVSYTLMTILGMILYRKIAIRPGAWLWIGVALVSFGYLIAFFRSPWWLILSTLITTMGLFYFSVVWNSEQFLLFHDFSPVKKLRVFVWRENLICFGRIITLTLFLPVQNVSGISIYILVSIAITFGILVPYVQHHAIGGYVS